MIYNKDSLKQKVKEFLDSYTELNKRISNKEIELTELNNNLTILLNELKEIRKEEEKWNQEQATKLNITYKEYTKLTKDAAMELNNLK
jgi:chromosome segregation ATPase